MATVKQASGLSLRGRAASIIRTGIFIRQYLLTSGEASITEIHQALKDEIRAENANRKRPIRKPTYESFSKYFRNLRTLGLVEFAGKEEATMKTGLLSIRSTGIVPSVKRFYRLTTSGSADPPHDGFYDPIRVLGLRVTTP